MDTNKKIREHISALSDGALHPDDLELALAALQASDGRQAWEIYHRIGDVMRAAASPDLSPDFSARLAARLAAEPAHARRATGAANEPESKPKVVAASASAS
ncbi:MAG TPA: sigma-E factor negative regulatory protein [Telluria sp.]|nr:sigma-E factor negative regulatory protein [Telluria sp.]